MLFFTTTSYPNPSTDRRTQLSRSMKKWTNGSRSATTILSLKRMDYYLKYMRNIKPIAGPDDDGFVFIGDGND